MKLKNLILVFFSIAIVFLNTGCTPKTYSQEQVSLTISIAASMTDVMNEIKTSYVAEHPNIQIHYNIGGSGTLQQQIQQGAPVDLFISASEDKMDQLEKKGLLLNGSRKNLLTNELVLITSLDTKLNSDPIQGLASSQIKHVALGDPDSVPAGKYGKQALENLHFWNQVSSKIVKAKDVRTVLSYVETGNAEAGIVYHSDVIHDQKVKVVKEFDSSTHSPIIYPVAIISDTKNELEAQKFLEFLFTKQAKDMMRSFGFNPDLK